MVSKEFELHKVSRYAYSGRPVDIIISQNIETLLQILFLVHFSSPANIGYNTFFERIKKENLPALILELEPQLEDEFAYKVHFPGRTLWAVESVFDLRPINIHSRATRVWKAYDEKGRKVAMHVAWYSESRGTVPGEEIVQSILNDLQKLSIKTTNGIAPFKYCPATHKESDFILPFQNSVSALIKGGYEDYFLHSDNIYASTTAAYSLTEACTPVPADVFPPAYPMPSITTGHSLASLYRGFHPKSDWSRAGAMAGDELQDPFEGMHEKPAAEWGRHELLRGNSGPELWSMDSDDDSADGYSLEISTRSSGAPKRRAVARINQTVLFEGVCYRLTQLSSLSRAFVALNGALHGK